MKIVFTESEVKEIVMDYVARAYSANMTYVKFNPYMGDYCEVSDVDAEQPGEKSNGSK